MKRLLLVFITIFVSPFGVVSDGTAYFKEAGVQEFRTPVEAPKFTLKRAGGGECCSKEMKGKVILLNFFTTW